MRRRRIRSQAGFTLIELLVVVIIIGILAAIALPNFIGAQDKAREASVKANMRTAQIAAEAYATDNGGTYPSQIDNAYKSYFPGGKSDGQQISNATGAVNPFTNASEFPSLGTISNIQTVRGGPPASAGVSGNPGEIKYCNFEPATTYAIIGIGKSNLPLGGTAPNTTLVLSNQ